MIFMFPDEIVSAMSSPMMVNPKPVTMEDMGDDDDDESEKVAVARLSSKLDSEKQLVWTYIEVAKNRVFESHVSDVERAYQEFLICLSLERMEKADKLEKRKDKEANEMRRVMKCSIIAYLDSLQQSEMTQIDPAKIDNMLRRNMSILYEVMDIYFKTGISLGCVVNNPKNIYLECVDLHSDVICQAVSGMTKLVGKDDKVYMEALAFLSGEK